MVHGLEVLQNFDSIQDISYSTFFKFTEELATSYEPETFDNVVNTRTYKKSTISFFREILDFHNIPNNLNKYLSALSEYKHPTMKELYVAAHGLQ